MLNVLLESKAPHTRRVGGTLASTLVADRYRLVRSLGHGAMAEVWEANDELLQRRVAISIGHLQVKVIMTGIRR